MNDHDVRSRPAAPDEHDDEHDDEPDGIPQRPRAEVVRRSGRRAATGVVLLLVLLVAGAVVAVLDDRPATDLDTNVDASGNAKCAPPQSDDAPGYPALCAALNRPDLPELAGVPGGQVSLAGSHLVLRLDGDGKEPPVATAQVQIGSVQVSVTDQPDLAPKDFLIFSDLPRAQAPVLGHPVSAYRMRTIGGTGATGTPGPGGYSRHLVVAKSADGSGGSFDLSYWRRDATTDDDTALRRIAEAVLPTLQGWAP
ncbi:hypothetical protein SAMN05216371_6440 [Streptomyces sp. TLI_053]|uniref:DUF6215 domain-containing protein n=1 Tax=Streptomyces sp. TLI_053 TaxID=1855352 RepID=UPI00087CCA95|nr:DUF6215 domain-containing protein [Streptomyces sp. TLI_053]SDT80785.1 hypothetical protein SAMN05216371_6440 [Streptomyces sp. TLI_053]